ncbi:MAG: hypothetical protein ABR587_13815 [Candidatus Binatia bacterium]
MATLHLGYFADLASRDTILMEADVMGLREMREIFQALASGRIRRLVLHRLPFVRAHAAIELRALCSNHDRGARRDDAGNAFLWERSSAGWRNAAEQLAQLADAPQAGHQYLDAEQNDVAVTVSKGEYGEKWWAQHG